MKILIIGLSKIKYMPYINFYLDAINHEKNSIHVCYWNRDGREEDLSNFDYITFHEFCFIQTNGVSKIKKIVPFIKYKKFLSKIIDIENFDFIIFLHSLSGILIRKKLKNNKYIFDYRDSTYEKNIIFKNVIKKLVVNSYATFSSSEGFLKYLPKVNNIYISHNLLLDSLNHRIYLKTESDKIRISFWGYIRHFELNKTIINKLCNDNRFELHYYGREQEDALALKEYAKIINANNVFFHGEYIPNDRYEFIKNTDIIHNLYYDDNMMLAMGNKYYDGIIFKIPQICFKESLMGKMVSSKNIGLECDPNDEDFANNIFEYYKLLDFKNFIYHCDIELDRVLSEYKTGIKIIEGIQ